jgi:hypothetical protein
MSGVRRSDGSLRSLSRSRLLPEFNSGRDYPLSDGGLRKIHFLAGVG